MAASPPIPEPVRPFAVTHAGVLRLAAPMTLAYLTVPLIGLVDTAVIGRLGIAALLGGIAIGAVVLNVIFTTFNFLRSGTTGLTAQAFGAQDAAESRAVLARAMLLALGAGLAIVLLQNPLISLGIRLMGVEGGVADAARLYLRVRIWGAPLGLANYVLIGWLLGLGRSGTVLALQTLLALLNVVLSLLFVLTFRWGVAGVAAASVLAELAVVALGAGIVVQLLAATGRWQAARILDPAGFRRILAVNRDIMIRSFALLFAFAFFTREGARFGDIVLAANAILLQVFFVASYFLDGIANAAEQLAGRAVGARFRPASERAVRLTLLWGGLLAGMLALAGILLGPAFIDLLTTSPEVREAARRYLAYAALTPLAGVVAFQMDGIFIGATWSRDMRNLMLLSVAAYLAAWSVLVPAFGNHGLWASLLVFLAARSLAFRWRMRALLRRTFPA